MAKAALIAGAIAAVLWSLPYERVMKKEANAHIDGVILHQSK